MVEILLVIFVPFILLVLSLVILTLLWRPRIDRYLDIRDKEVKNNKYRIYNNTNLEVVNTEIDTYIQGYIDRYVLYKFLANKVPYINEDATNEMIRDVTKNIALDISDLILYYISLIQAYETDEELIRFIKTRVTNSAIEFVTNYNATNIPAV